jgi:hypothetical protein
MSRLRIVLAFGVILTGCEPTTEPASRSSGWFPVAATGSTASIRFGLNELGSPFPPQAGHDHSTNAVDNLVPRTVTIPRGGTVVFAVDPVHQAAVYRPGVEPEDIAVDGSTLEDADLGFGIVLPLFRINDPAGRLASSPSQGLSPQSWSPPPGTFDQPGRYLVICTSVPHFVLNRMFGWVIVK